MKTLLITLAVLAVSMSVAGVVHAGNKYSDYRNMVEATKGTIAAETHAWKHLNKFVREQAKGSGFGTILPSAEQQQLPKNFRNN